MTTKQKIEIEATKSKETKKNVSTKGVYSYIKKAWLNPSDEHKAILRKRMISWRKGQRIVKLEKPSRLDRARNLGYKAKRGIIIFRIAVKRGGHKRQRPSTKRRSKRMTIQKNLKMSYQWIAEQRFQKNYPTLEVLNSYHVGKDGKYYYFEIIAIDPNIAEIKSDKNLNWICKSENRNRALRGLTSAGKKSRGLSTKSRNLKVRPSLSAWNHLGK